MDRRNFLKILGVAPLAPSVLCAREIRSGTRRLTFGEISEELGESRSFIYRGFYFTVQDIFDSELKYMALHPFFKIQGILCMFILNDQFDDLQKRHRFLDEMIRQWKEKQIYTTEELRGF